MLRKGVTLTIWQSHSFEGNTNAPARALVAKSIFHADHNSQRRSISGLRPDSRPGSSVEKFQPLARRARIDGSQRNDAGGKDLVAPRNGNGRTESDESAGRRIQWRRGIRGWHSPPGRSRPADLGRRVWSSEQWREWTLLDGAARGRGRGRELGSRCRSRIRSSDWT